MIYWLFYFLAAFGLSYIVGFAKISAPLRNFIAPIKQTKSIDTSGTVAFEVNTVEKIGHPLRHWFIELLECPACFGFWEGLAFGLAVPHAEVNFFALALATSAANFILARLTQLM